jgi:hypothetical protein
MGKAGSKESDAATDPMSIFRPERRPTSRLKLASFFDEGSPGNGVEIQWLPFCFFYCIALLRQNQIFLYHQPANS